MNTDDFYIHPLEKKFFYQNHFSSLPSIFSKNGYLTAAIGDNFFIHGFSEWALDIGFGEVKDFEKLKHESVYIVDDVLQWIKRTEGVPFFLYISFNQTHVPYKPSINHINFLIIILATALNLGPVSTVEDITAVNL